MIQAKCIKKFRDKKEIYMGKSANDRKHKIDAVSNEYAVKLIFALSKYFNKSICDIISILDEIDYWGIINDSETCCLLAHDGIKSNIQEIEESINEVLSRN